MGFFCFFFLQNFWIPVYLFFAHKHKSLWYFCFIYFSQFCLFISLIDYWIKNKKWLIPVVILAVIVVPLCIWWAIQDTKKEKKKRVENREKQRLMNRQVKRIIQNQCDSGQCGVSHYWKKCWWNKIKIHDTEEIARVLQFLDDHIKVFILCKSPYISLT